MKNFNIVITFFLIILLLVQYFLKIILRVYTKENLFTQNEKSFFAYEGSLLYYELAEIKIQSTHHQLFQKKKNLNNFFA
jgi:hypothetical protein